MKVRDLTARELRRRLAGEGLLLRIGPLRASIGTTVPHLAAAIEQLYANYPLASPGILDFDIRVDPVRGPRRFLNPLARFYVDGSPAFEPFPQPLATPMMQWLMNWCIFTRPHQYLILHAGVLERGGHALLLPGPPGAGKSTLCAALHLRGWRLFSDEVAMVTPGTVDIHPAPLPPSLKNASIDVIRRYEPDAVLSPPVPGTRKGVVAHLQVGAASLDRSHVPAPAAWVVFPNYQPDATVNLQPTSRARSLLWMAHNAFNYSLLGATGFDALADVIDACECYELTYSRLDDALEVLSALAEARAAASPTVVSVAPVELPEEPVVTNEVTATRAPDVTTDLLLAALRDPSSPVGLDAARWNELLRMARNTKVLARLGILAEQAGLLTDYPVEAQLQCLAARALADQHHRIVRWETNRLMRALRDVSTPVVLLKGAAYVMDDLPAARGRLCSDVDIMVPRDRLEDVERTLLSRGWEAMKLDPYDQRYYRTWMHELPPMRHRSRRTVLDVHHNILPVSGRFRPDAALLFDAAEPLPGTTARRLCAVDMVLHSAAHLFQDGEMAGGLRDVLDLHDLLTHFSEAEATFGGALTARAKDLGLARPLYYALRMTHDLMGTVVSGALLGESRLDRPTAAVRGLMDGMIRRAVLPDPPGPTPVLTRLSRLGLYVRAHWQRMPPGLLARHLGRKAWRQVIMPEETPEQQAQP